MRLFPPPHPMSNGAYAQGGKTAQDRAKITRSASVFVQIFLFCPPPSEKNCPPSLVCHCNFAPTGPLCAQGGAKCDQGLTVYSKIQKL